MNSVTTGTAICPICAAKASQPLLAMRGVPIYQHPVLPDALPPQPWFIDLDYRQCDNCGHAWQPDVDMDQLSRIYEHYYYTPAPDGVGAEFREDFLAALSRFGLLARSITSVLEIGAAAGDTLTRLRDHFGAARALAFEPNHNNAGQARRRGLSVREAFFSTQEAEALHGEGDTKPAAFDLIFARHVIEHVFDFDDVLRGIEVLAHAQTDFVLETPCLDWHVARGSTAPFHVEHNHVFSLASLAHLARRAGWQCCSHEVTAAGNMILWFRRDATGCKLPAMVSGAQLQAAVTQRTQALRDSLAGHRLLFWGAGSASCKLTALLGREPDFLVDGNPAKAGKVFVGGTRRIAEAEPTLQALMALPRADWPLVVIASSFDREIRTRLAALGWTGEILSLHGSAEGVSPEEDGSSASSVVI